LSALKRSHAEVAAAGLAAVFVPVLVQADHPRGRDQCQHLVLLQVCVLVNCQIVQVMAALAASAIVLVVALLVRFDQIQAPR
jgi:hypothetical protein